MSSLEDLFDDAFISDWLKSHAGSAEEVNKAAKLLAGKPDALEALKKLLPSLQEKVVKVFFSYKKKDERAATEVVQLLRTYSANKLKICYQADFTEDIAGRQWRQKIKEEVCRANWFILLLPDPSDDWDWCLYETGLFDHQTTSADRVICLHHPNTEIPDPIKDYHHVPANVPDVEDFLRMVYLKDNPIPGLPSLNPFAESEIPRIAREIVSTFRPPFTLFQEVYEPWIALKVEYADKLETKEDLDDALIECANQDALALFDYADQPSTWGQLRSYISEAQGDSRWREEMFHVIRRIGQGRKFHSVQAVFQANNNKFYRPVVYAVDKAGRTGPAITFHITFSEDVTAIDSSAMPLELSRLATILRFTFRFRWEILEKFVGKISSDDDIVRLDNAFHRIQTDWDSRGIGKESEILNLFSGEKKQRVLEMMLDWNRVKNRKKNGTLDIAIENRDTNVCSDILGRFLPMNQEFLEIVTDRFNELISSKLPMPGNLVYFDKATNHLNQTSL
jgi:hypothetical protein